MSTTGVVTCVGGVIQSADDKNKYASWKDLYRNGAIYAKCMPDGNGGYNATMAGDDTASYDSSGIAKPMNYCPTPTHKSCDSVTVQLAACAQTDPAAVAAKTMADGSSNAPGTPVAQPPNVEGNGNPTTKAAGAH